MLTTLDQAAAISEIKKIQQLLSSLPNNLYGLETRDDRTFVLKSKNRSATSDNRNIDITIQSLIHGNEVGGIFVASEILRLIVEEIINPKLNICISFGNIEALKIGKRFMESDLNRSFGMTEHNNFEEKLAKRLERIYQESFVLVDLHQTQSPTLEPFFISRFDPISFNLIRVISPETNVVTYFEQNFGGKQMTTVNYHLSKGGIGFGIELGETGKVVSQIEFGVSLLLKTLSTLEFWSLHKRFPKLTSNYEVNVYSFDEAVKSKTGNFLLRPGLSNMMKIEKDELIGEIDLAPYRSSFSGRILFPVYLKEGEQGKINSDVCRFLKPIEPENLKSHLKN